VAPVLLSAGPSLPSPAATRASAAARFLRPSRHSPSGWVAVLAPAAPPAPRVWLRPSGLCLPLAAVPPAARQPLAGAAARAAIAACASRWAAALPPTCRGVVVRGGLVSVPVQL
jgi:hypothetical protein